jgi:hypothetical protein
MEPEITLKEVFKQLVKLEAETDIMKKINDKNTRKFTYYAVFILIVSFTSLLIHLFLFLLRL